MHFTGAEVNLMNESLQEKLQAMSNKDPNISDTLAALKELHGTSAGLKAFCMFIISYL
jgi:hypothetical protein